MKKTSLLLLAALVNVAAMAQGSDGAASVDVNVGTKGGGGGSMWMWIIGGIVLVILLVVLLGRGRSSNTTTIIKD